MTAPKAESGKTKEDGLIETEIPPDAKSGTLKVTKIFEAPVIPPDPPAAAAADPSLVVYPRPIAPGEFKDAAPPDPATLENDVEWTLKIGSLPCPKEDAGVIARLENLGYSCGSETSPGPKTAAAVKAYERKHEVEPLTGSVTSVRDAIARLLLLRCILQELAWSAQIPDLAHLIRREDIPRAPQRLPRALTPQQDQLIQQELLRRNDLPSNVLLLMRHTGMRIGECVDLAYDCLHSAGPGRWAIHVPLGKLKTERMVPVDSFVCGLVHRLRFFRSFDPLPFDGRLLARPRSKQTLVKQLRSYLPDVVAAVSIPTRIVPHQLRHYATSRTMPRRRPTLPFCGPLDDIHVA